MSEKVVRKNRVACEKHNDIRLSTNRKYGVVELQRAVNALAVLSHVTGFCAGWIRSSGIRFILQDYLRAGGPRPFNAEPSSRLILNVRINYWAAVCIHAFVTWVHYDGSMFWRVFGSPRMVVERVGVPSTLQYATIKSTIYNSLSSAQIPKAIAPS